VKKTAVLLTTVGPYALYGEKVFKACAESGTHYFDVTGEFPWVLKMIRKYEKTAQASGALMFPQIGIESAPADMCTWALAKVLREQLGAKTKDTVVTIHKLKLVYVRPCYRGCANHAVVPHRLEGHWQPSSASLMPSRLERFSPPGNPMRLRPFLTRSRDDQSLPYFRLCSVTEPYPTSAALPPLLRA
jgi:hypothetical protein